MAGWVAGPPCIIMPLCGPTCKIARFQAGLKFPSWTECGKNQLFPQGQNPKNLQKVHTIIKDKKKTNKANKVYQVFQYNITEGQVEINPRRWNKKRYSASLLTWFNNQIHGLFDLPTAAIPENKSESAREITSMKNAEFFKSTSTRFSDFLRFSDSKRNMVVATFLNNATMICGHKVYQLATANVYINLSFDLTDPSNSN